MLLEQYTLVLKAARRCAYDLGHAASECKDRDMGKLYHARHNMWLEIFSPTGGKDYRHDLHRQIAQLEREIEDLKAESSLTPNIKV